MPSLQQFDSGYASGASMRSLNGVDTDILHKHSINSLLEQRQDFLSHRNDTTENLASPLNDIVSKSEVLDFSKGNTNGMLLSNMDTFVYSPLAQYTPLTPSSTQSLSSPSNSSYDVFQFENVAQSTPIKAFQRNKSFDCSAPLSPSTTSASLYNRSFHSSPLASDGSNLSSANGLSLDSISTNFQSNGGAFWSRSNSPESQNSGHSNTHAHLKQQPNILVSNSTGSNNTNYTNLIDIMNLLALNPETAQPATHLPTIKIQNTPPMAMPPNLFDEQNLQNFDALSTVDSELTKNLQNLQALNTLKLLQAQTQQIPLLNQLLQGYNNVNQFQLKSLQHPVVLPPSPLQVQQNVPAKQNEGRLDRLAKIYNSSAALYDSTCTWSGQLPTRSHRILNYSPKVFLGGIPWDISEQSLIQIFRPFGPIKVEWPGKEQQASQPKGYVYIIFESDRQVKALLSACAMQVDETQSDIYYFKISSRRIKSKDVEVIPWIIADSNCVKLSSQKLDPNKTVFVGALHGTMTAEGLAKIMNDLFDGVLYAGIDTDKYKYPIGSGRVTFNNNRSYMRAINAAFIDIRTEKFTKKVQVKPYLEDSLCSICGVQHGPYFCRELSCFRYFCITCWHWQHALEEIKNHKPLTRNSKSQVLVGIGPSSSNASMPSASTPTLNTYSGNKQQQRDYTSRHQHQQQESKHVNNSEKISLCKHPQQYQ